MASADKPFSEQEPEVAREMAGPSPITAASRAGPQTDATASPPGLVAYRLLTRLARPAAGAILGIRARRGKEDASRRDERLGRASCARPEGTVVWVHAASVGEVAAILPLLHALGEHRPDGAVVLTTGTVTSARFAANRLPANAIHQFVPLDSPRFVGRFLDHWRPSLAILTEQEIWPNLVVETRARQIPLALVNARMSDRSFERWKRRRGVAEALFSRFSVVLAQNEALAMRFSDLGAPRAIAAGNLKIDAPAPRVDAQARVALASALEGRPRMVAASTHEGEEAVVAAAHRILASRFDRFCTIIAPRHPERGPSLAGSLEALGFHVARRSLGELPGAGTEIYVADTIGELGCLYASTEVAFVGGSLISHGGQNPIEAVRHGAAVLTGPSWTNFSDAYQALLHEGGAFEIRSAPEMADRATELISDPIRLARTRDCASHALEGLSGALARTMSVLLPLIPAPTPEQQRAS